MSVTIGSGHEGNVREQVNAYVARVKGGEMGALPSVLSLFVLTLLFSLLNPYFLTQGNFANLLTQTATLMMIAMALVFVILIAKAQPYNNTWESLDSRPVALAYQAVCAKSPRRRFKTPFSTAKRFLAGTNTKTRAASAGMEKRKVPLAPCFNRVWLTVS